MNKKNGMSSKHITDQKIFNIYIHNCFSKGEQLFFSINFIFSAVMLKY